MKADVSLDRATTVNEQLAAIVMRAEVLYSGKSSHRPHIGDSIHSPHLASDVDEIDSPSFSITDGDSSDEEGQVPGGSKGNGSGLRLDLPTGPFVEPPISPRSPVESRAMTLEEGEVFRKGQALGVGDDEIDDKATEGVSGEELKETVSGLPLDRHDSC